MKDLNLIKKGFIESFEYLTKRCSDFAEQDNFRIREIHIDGVSIAIGIHNDLDRIRLYTINPSFTLNHSLRYRKIFEISTISLAKSGEIVFMTEIHPITSRVDSKEFYKLFTTSKAINDLLGNIAITLFPE